VLDGGPPAAGGVFEAEPGVGVEGLAAGVVAGGLAGVVFACGWAGELAGVVAGVVDVAAPPAAAPPLADVVDVEAGGGVVAVCPGASASEPLDECGPK
jgi:hypothetical protein